MIVIEWYVVPIPHIDRCEENVLCLWNPASLLLYRSCCRTPDKICMKDILCVWHIISDTRKGSLPLRTNRRKSNRKNLCIKLSWKVKVMINIYLRATVIQIPQKFELSWNSQKLSGIPQLLTTKENTLSDKMCYINFHENRVVRYDCLPIHGTCASLVKHQLPRWNISEYSRMVGCERIRLL